MQPNLKNHRLHNTEGKESFVGLRFITVEVNGILYLCHRKKEGVLTFLTLTQFII